MTTKVGVGPSFPTPEGMSMSSSSSNYPPPPPKPVVTTPWKLALRTFLQFLVPGILLWLLGGLSQITEWANCMAEGTTTCAPVDVSGLAYGLLVVILSSVAAFVTWAQNAFEDRRGKKFLADTSTD